MVKVVPSPGADFAVVQANDPLRDGQAEPGAGTVARRIGAEEALKNMRQILRADADAVIGHGDPDLIALAARAAERVAAVAAVFDCVFGQVEQQLRDQALIGGEFKVLFHRARAGQRLGRAPHRRAV